MSTSSCTIRRTMICISVWVAVLFMFVSLGEAKTTTREYAKSSFSIMNIVEKVLPEIGCKITWLDRNTNAINFLTNGKRQMSIQIVDKGKDTCSVEITGSAWFSNEPEEVASKINAKINDVLVNREAQRIASAQKPEPKEAIRPSQVASAVENEIPPKKIPKIVIMKKDYFIKKIDRFEFNLIVRGSVKNAGNADAKDIIIKTHCDGCRKSPEGSEWGYLGGETTVNYLASGDKENFEYVAACMITHIYASHLPGQMPPGPEGLKTEIVSFQKAD